MIDILTFATGFVVGSVAAFVIFRLYVRWLVGLLTSRLAQDHTQAGIEVQAKLEMINDQFYLFNLDTDEFMVQGGDFVELRQALAHRYPQGFRVNIINADQILHSTDTQS